ncbi:MAG: YceI family protein [Acidobacteria bacterium]|nr:YceI family protein [Acidobacteriota bacterium]
MIFRSAVALIVVLSMAATVFAQGPQKQKPLTKKYPLTIDGTATIVGGWACGGDAAVSAVPADAAEPVPGLAAGVQVVTVVASVPQIDCGDGTMNKHLRKALKMDKHPEIKYIANKYTLIDDDQAVQTSGELTIAGVTKPVGVGAKLIPLPEGGARVVGKVEIDMAEYGVKPPSLFFGTLKVAKVVTVTFDTVVRLPNEMTQALFPASKAQEAVGGGN